MVVKIALVNVMFRKEINKFVEWSVENEVSMLCITEAAERVEVNGGYDVVQSPGPDRGAAVVMINKQLEYKCPYIRRRHVVIKLIATGITINHWYIPPGTNAAEVESLSKLLEKPKRGVIHLGDFNARTFILDTTETKRGRTLVDAFQRGDFILLNEPGRPTFLSRQKPGQASVIDWVLVSSNMRDKARLEYLPALLGSDHETLLVTLATKGKLVPKMDRKVVAPAAFLRRIEQLTEDDSTDDWFVKFMEAVEHAQRTKIERRSAPPTEGLQVLRTQLNDLLQTIRKGRGKTTHLWPMYRQLSQMYNEKTREYKLKENFARMKNLDVKSLWKETRQLAGKNSKVKAIMHGDGLVHGSDASRILLDHFYPAEEVDMVQLQDNLPPNDPPLTKVEIETALQHFSNATAPGKSGVDFRLMKQWYARKQDYFVKLFSEWFEAGVYPDELKESVIVALVKNRRQPPAVNNVRPIALNETIARWYERVVDTRLIYILESRNLISEDQYGFRPGLSADDATLRLQEIREQNKGKFELMIQTDVKSAFDKVSHKAIVDALVAKNIPGNIIRIIASFISQRQASMCMGEDWVTTQVKRGVPQGSCLGPHLYILTTDLMLRALRDEMNRATSTTSNVVAFADDVVLVTAAKRDQWTVNRAQSLVKNMTKELNKVGLSMANDKLKFMMSDHPKGSTITFNGKELNLETEMKILGITFSHDGVFSKHMNQLEEKAEQYVRQHASLIYSGLTRQMRRNLVVQSLIPKLIYGAKTWYRKLSRSDRDSLERVSRIVGRIATGASSHPGVATVTLLADMLPFHLQCKLTAELSKQCKSPELGIMDTKASRIDAGHPSTWRRRDFGSTMTTNDEVAKIEADVSFYTDGSLYTEDGKTYVGAAVVRCLKNADGEAECEAVKLIKLSDKNTVFQSEAKAIAVACKEAASYPPGTKVAIFSDSLSALRAIESPVANQRLIIECQAQIDETRAAGVDLSLHHVKAHVGIRGNEAADTAAKEAAKTGSETMVPAAVATAKRKIREGIYTEYEKWYWTKAGSVIKSFFRGPRDPMLKKAKVEPRTTSMYSGQDWNLASQRYGFKGALANCDCGSQQSTPHVLTGCPKYIEGNLAVARTVGITLDQLLAPWEQIREHPQFHNYVQRRAHSLSALLRTDNAFHAEIKELSDLFRYTLRISEEDDKEYPASMLHLPELYADTFLSQFVHGKWKRDLE